VANTPRQILLCEALGWTPPHYGHLPMIQGPDRTRLSKRHGATSVLEFQREGFLPDALVNFLALLGWSFDDKTEIMSREELIQRFALERVNRSAAVFDREKLLWMNGVYLRDLGLERAAALAREFFIQDGLTPEQLPEPWFSALVAMELERSRTLREMREHLNFFFVDTLADYDEPGARKHFLAAGANQRLARLAATLAATPFEPQALDAALRTLAEQSGEKFGVLIHPLRLALTGRTFSPGIFDVLSALGRERTLRRIEDARAWIQRQGAASTDNPSPGPSKGAS
jgi:glutamyl-tRNA synthetase